MLVNRLNFYSYDLVGALGVLRFLLHIYKILEAAFVYENQIKIKSKEEETIMSKKMNEPRGRRSWTGGEEFLPGRANFEANSNSVTPGGNEPAWKAGTLPLSYSRTATYS